MTERVRKMKGERESQRQREREREMNQTDVSNRKRLKAGRNCEDELNWTRKLLAENYKSALKTALSPNPGEQSACQQKWKGRKKKRFA